MVADKKLCFVIGPIGDEGSDIRRHANWLLKGIIKPVFADHFPDFNVERADEIVAPGSINAQVITRLMDAALVIADMSLHNSNAFYELAIRHMVRLPTIHMILKDWKIPFDVSPYRAIRFSRDDCEDIEAAQKALKDAVEEAIQPEFQVENPVTHARGRVEFQKHASPEERVLSDELAALRDGVAELQRETKFLRNFVVHAAQPRNLQGYQLTSSVSGVGLSQPFEGLLGSTGPTSPVWTSNPYTSPGIRGPVAVTEPSESSSIQDGAGLGILGASPEPKSADERQD